MERRVRLDARFLTAYRDILFEGYTDALSIKLMNKELTARNLTIQCSRRHVIEWNMYCQPTYDGDCTNTGYQVKHHIITRQRLFHLYAADNKISCAAALGLFSFHFVKTGSHNNGVCHDDVLPTLAPVYDE